MAAAAKIPVWRTVGQAYTAWFEHFPELLRISWMWLILLLPVFAVISWVQIPSLVEIMTAALNKQPYVDEHPARTSIIGVIQQLLLLVPMASIAVAWHRLLLRDEHVPVGRYLRADSVVAGYALLAFLMAAIVLVPNWIGVLVRGYVVGAMSTAGATVFFFGSVLSIVGLFIMSRLSLALPPKALGGADVSLKDAWQSTKGNSWRLLFAYFLCLLPFFAIFGGMAFVVYRPEVPRVLLTLFLVANNVAWLLFGMVSIGFLSFGYRHFFETESSPPL
jgi:hypothetical protein